MARKSNGASYVLTLETKPTPAQRKRLLAGEEVARQIENTCKGILQKGLRGLRGDPKWREAVAKFSELTAKKKLTPDERQQKKDLSIEMHELKRKYRLTEFQMHEEAAKINQHFGRVLSINEAQKAATRAFNAFEKYRKGEAKKLRFKSRGEAVTLENKSNDFGLRERDGRLLWKDKFEAPLIVKSNDHYAQMAMQDKTKYVRVFRQKIRGKERFFVQLVKAGTPPTKKRTVGSEEHPVGMDLGPSSVAICQSGTDKAFIQALPTGSCEREDVRIVRSQKRASRSLRLTNPDCFDDKGAWIKRKKAVKSKNCLMHLAKVADLKRKRVIRRKAKTNELANKIVALGSVVVTEDHSIKAWTTRAKDTKFNKKNGRIARKSRFGKSVASHAPGALRQEVDRRLKQHGTAGLLKAITTKVKASQLQHDTGTYVKKPLNTRWFDIAGEQVQRDLYSAFLLSHVDRETLDKVDLAACQNDWSAYLNAQKIALANADPSLSVL